MGAQLHRCDGIGRDKPNGSGAMKWAPSFTASDHATGPQCSRKAWTDKPLCLPPDERFEAVEHSHPRLQPPLSTLPRR